METLRVSSNAKLEGNIPTELGKCARLDEFDISYTSLASTIPETFADLVYLRQVRIECSKVKLPLVNGLCNHSAKIYLYPQTQDQKALTNCPCWERIIVAPDQLCKNL